MTRRPAGSTPESESAGGAVPVLDRALTLVRFLRQNCEWDAKQTPESLLPYLLEEAHEVADAVTARDDEALPGELGDLLLNVAFQIVLAVERQAFDADVVVRRLEQKMRRRHPHLYGDGEKQDWELLKASERAADAPDASLLADLPKTLDPLSHAHRIQDRVSAVGFDWPGPAGAVAKVREELAELEASLADAVGRDTAGADIEEEVGDLLFSVVNTARLVGAHAMLALRGANEKFARRFRSLEALARQRGIRIDESGLEELDALWDEVKAVERGGARADGRDLRSADPPRPPDPARPGE